MKRKLLILGVLLLSVSSVVMAGTTWTALTGNYDKNTLRDNDNSSLQLDSSSAGIGMQVAHFTDKNFGVIVNLGFLWDTDDSKSFTWDRQISTYVGPGYRLALGKEASLYGSVGFALKNFRDTNKVLGVETILSVNQIGIGAMAGAQVQIQPSLSILGGIQAGHYFNISGKGSIGSNSIEQTVEDTSAQAITPFVGIAYTL